MKNKTKNESDSLLRIPKAKNKLGLKIHKIAMPHDDLIRAEEKPRLELIDNNTLPSQTSHTGQSSQGQNSLINPTKQIAPIKDFQKTPNSLTRRAIPDGLFKGKSKQLYDTLYSLTRGAITPIRHTRIRKSKLMKLANIGSRATFDSNISHLQIVGLIRETVLPGEHEGNKFEIFLPEEITGLPSQSSQTRLSSQTEHAQKQDRLVSLETSQTRQSLTTVDTCTLDMPKTSLKTNTNDDEAFTHFIEIFHSLALEVTGKKLSRRDAEKLKELAELLTLEFKIASRRTESISSVPAFLTEVLRRKLRDIPTSSANKSVKVKKDAIAKSESESYEIKPLNEQGREEALAQLREFAADDFLEDFKKWYTSEDWEWLIKELGIKK